MLTRIAAVALLMLAVSPAFASDASYDKKTLPAWEQSAVAITIDDAGQKAGTLVAADGGAQAGSAGGIWDAAEVEQSSKADAQRNDARGQWLAQIHGAP